MKEYFINLFKYDRFANLLILDTIKKTSDNAQAVKLMAHLLAAQQIWLGRCKNAPPIGAVLWPDWNVDTLEQHINANHQGWTNFLEYLSPDDFDSIISYKNLQGDNFENKLSDILSHVINHGTHHRAQAGQHLKLAGAELPTMDYIFYLRTKGL